MRVLNEIMPIHTNFMSNIKLWNLWFVTNLADLSNKYCTFLWYNFQMRLMCWELYKIHLYFENILIEYFLNGWAERHFSADQIAEVPTRNITNWSSHLEHGGVVSLDWVNNIITTIYYATSFSDFTSHISCAYIRHI